MYLGAVYQVSLPQINIIGEFIVSRFSDLPGSTCVVNSNRHDLMLQDITEIISKLTLVPVINIQLQKDSMEQILFTYNSQIQCQNAILIFNDVYVLEEYLESNCSESWIRGNEYYVLINVSCSVNEVFNYSSIIRSTHILYVITVLDEKTELNSNVPISVYSTSKQQTQLEKELHNKSFSKAMLPHTKHSFPQDSLKKVLKVSLFNYPLFVILTKDVRGTTVLSFVYSSKNCSITECFASCNWCT